MEAEDPWGGIYLWLLVLSGGFGAFVYGLDDLIITALMMREFVEGAAVLVACVCSTTLPAVVCATSSLVWKFISLFFPAHDKATVCHPATCGGSVRVVWGLVCCFRFEFSTFRGGDAKSAWCV